MSVQLADVKLNINSAHMSKYVSVRREKSYKNKKAAADDEDEEDD